MSTTRQACADCAILSPEVNTNYTLIEAGWRLTRARAADGTLVPEWRCPACWRVFRSGDAAPPSSTAGASKPASGVQGFVSPEAAEAIAAGVDGPMRTDICGGCGIDGPRARTTNTLTQEGWRMTVGADEGGTTRVLWLCPACWAKKTGAQPLTVDRSRRPR
jgi:hypothetical protein